MAQTTVVFDASEPYVGSRPVIDMELHGPGGPYGTVFPIANAIVDTGADYTQLEIAAAVNVGLDPANDGRIVSIATAGGVVQVHELDVEVECLGQRLTIRAHFSLGAAPLLGRQGLFLFAEGAGFETTEWLQRWYP